MGLLKLLLCFVIGHFFPVYSTIDKQAAMLSEGFMEHILHSSTKGDYFIPYDTIFSSWLTETPDFHMLGELPPNIQIPRIQVFCTISQLTLLVDNKFNGVIFKEDELLLGDGCPSNGELQNQLVFTYNFGQCGTNHEVHSGSDVFSNLLRFNPRISSSTWWLTPFAVPVSCIPKRSKEILRNPFPVEFPKKTFAIKAMDSNWIHTAESNMYQRGQAIHLQVTANPDKDQQLFIHSCFVAASADPNIRPRSWLIGNKGCAASMGSQHALTQFVPSRREDAVNFILNTSHLLSKVYVHCQVFISDKKITSYSKSCNYNNIQSRWEELNGDAVVCSCCGSKCKGSSLTNTQVDARAALSIGPLVTVDMLSPASPGQGQKNPSSTLRIRSMPDATGPGVNAYQTSSNPQSISGPHSALNERRSSGAAFSQSLPESNYVPEAPRPSSPEMGEGVLMWRQRPEATQALWLPGQMQVTDLQHDDLRSPLFESDAQFALSNMLSNEIPELNLRDKAFVEVNVPSMVTGWPVPPLPTLEAWPVPLLDGWLIPPVPGVVRGKFHGHQWGGRSQMRPRTQRRYSPVNSKNLRSAFNGDIPTQRPANALTHNRVNVGFQSAISSKLELSQARDGSGMLTYEEEVVRPGEAPIKKKTIGIFPRVQGRTENVDFQTFLGLLRNLNEAQ